MSSATQAIRKGFNDAARYAGQDIELQHRTFATEDSMDSTAQWTTSSSYHVGLVSHERNRSQREGENNTRMTVVTLDASKVSDAPTVETRVGVNGNYYSVAHVDLHQDAVYVLTLGGPVADATVAADTVAPRITVSSATGGETTFTYTATSNEAAHHRIRYRKQFTTWTLGSWVTGPGYTTSHAGTSPSLGAGVYETGIQVRDAAGNVSAFFEMDDVTISGVPG